MTVSRWIDGAEQALARMGDPEARLQAEWMLADAMGVPRLRLIYAMTADEIEGDALARADRWLSDRLTGRPLQYVQGCAWFMGHGFYVDERALIPRQDTELLCERAVALCQRPGTRFLDLCAGSGAVGISVKLACPDAEVCLSDLSHDALEVARINAGRMGAAVSFLEGDFLAPAGDMKFDVIAVNPPYLTEKDMGELQKEVAFEPKMALYGGTDGLDFYRRAAKEAPDHLNPGGTLLLEVGEGQAEDVCRLLDGGICHKDISGILRVVEKKYP